MKTALVILSRFSSSRLPGKALKELEGLPVLSHTYNRLVQEFPKEQIIVATSVESSDDQIADYCDQNGMNCYRGSLENVAERFYGAARELGSEYAVRINGDNVLIDLDLIRKCVLLAEQNQYDFVSNVKERTYPKGMSVEVLKTSFYGDMLQRINDSEDFREHVTLIFYQTEEQLGQYHFVYNEDFPELKGTDLALDTIEDFHRITAMIKQLPTYPEYKLKDIYEAYQAI